MPEVEPLLELAPAPAPGSQQRERLLELAAAPGSLWAALRVRRPLVQCCTNAVAMDLTANVLLAARCSPAMVSDASESAEFAQKCATALLINVGTLSPGALAGARAAAGAANAAGRPIVLDPVAMGGTAARSAAIVSLVRDFRPAVIKGNGSEMIALARALFASEGGGGEGVGAGAGAADDAPRGVDCAPGVTPEAKASAAASVARGCGCVAVVTGETDFIFWPPRAAEAPGSLELFEYLAVESGSALQPAVTAMGCSLGGLVAAFVGAAAAAAAEAKRELDPLLDVAGAAAAAVAAFGAAAVVAERSANGPGSFRVAFVDALWNLTEEEINALARMSLRGAKFRGASAGDEETRRREEKRVEAG